MVSSEVVQSKIYLIRGYKIMIDKDLAELYGVPTKSLNLAVKRNLKRFPLDFMYQLTKEETEKWMSQIAISNPGANMGQRKRPNAFTEQGVAMLSGILRSDKAINMNIAIMRAFVEIRKIAFCVKSIINNKSHEFTANDCKLKP